MKPKIMTYPAPKLASVQNPKISAHNSKISASVTSLSASLKMRGTHKSTKLRTLLPLLAILLAQAVASLSLHNTAFRDEALYLWAGRQVLRQWQGVRLPDDFSGYFSGAPFFYPVLGSLLDKIGGLELARLFSLGCMLCTTSAVYRMTRVLYDNGSAISAAALFAVQAPVLFIGHFATFDALCLSLMAAAATVAFSARTVLEPVHQTPPLNQASPPIKQIYLLSFRVGTLLLLAVVAKYAGLLFVPSILFIFAWQTSCSCGWRRALISAGAAASVVVCGIGLMLLLNPGLQNGINYTTLDRVAIGPASRPAIALHALTLGGGLVALAAIGILLERRRRERPLLLILLASAFLAPAYHIFKFEDLSLHKHIAFSAFFAAPLAGNALYKVSLQVLVVGSKSRLHFNRLHFNMTAAQRYPRQYGFLIGAAVWMLFAVVGVYQAHRQFQSWLNSDSYIQVLRGIIHPGEHVLAEVVDVPRYYLQDEVEPDQWSTFPWFQYTAPAGNVLQGNEAYQAAIANDYFDVVVLHYSNEAPMARAIDAGLKDNGLYALTRKLPGTWIWQKRQVIDEVDFSTRNGSLHNLHSFRSRTGCGPEGLRWRDAIVGGWFSFNLKTRPEVRMALVCTYWGSDDGRLFDILVNGRKIATQTLNSLAPGRYFSVTYPIPSRAIDNTNPVDGTHLMDGPHLMTVAFRARPGAMAGGVFGCRVVGIDQE